MKKTWAFMCTVLVAGTLTCSSARAEPLGFCGRTLHGKVLCWAGGVVAEKVLEYGLVEVWTWAKDRYQRSRRPPWEAALQYQEQMRQMQERQQRNRGWGWPSRWPAPPPPAPVQADDGEDESDDD